MRKAIVAALLLTALAGCSSDDGGAVAVPTQEPAASAQETSDISAGGDCQEAPADQPADLEMQDFVFAPKCLAITTSQPGLKIHNEGQATHNFSVKNASGLDVDVEPGQVNNTEALGLEAGTYEFFCEYHGESQDMKGELRVKAS